MKGRMTLDDVLDDMRIHGVSLAKKSLCDGLKKGYFPFAKILSVGETGRTTYLILRTDYERWRNNALLGMPSNGVHHLDIEPILPNRKPIITKRFVQEDEEIICEVVIKCWKKETKQY